MPITYAPNSHSAADWHEKLESLLNVVDSICCDNGITYSLCFGGLLGAIRHKGMIPWDNDADVVMTEENYKKFLQAYLDGKFPEGYQMVDRTTEPGYPLMFGRFMDVRTSCPLSTSSFNGGTNGVFIDVFILFPVPEQEEARIDCITDFLVWEELMCNVKRRCGNRSDLFIERWKTAKKVEAAEGREAALAWCEAQFRSKMPEKSKYCIHGSGGKYQGFPVLEMEWFAHPVYRPFGNSQFAVPNGYLDMLQRFYGCSWRTFPAGERYSTYSCANLNIPGYQIVDDYMQFFDKDQAIKDFADYKTMKVDEMIAAHERNGIVYDIEAKLAADTLNRQFENRISDCEAFLTRERLGDPQLDLSSVAALRDDLFDVIRQQSRSPYKTWRRAVPVNATLLSAALWSYYLTKPDFWLVEKIMGLQRADERNCQFGKSEADDCLQQAVSATAQLYLDIDRNDVESARAHVDVLEGLCPAGRHTRIGHAFVLLQASLKGAIPSGAEISEAVAYLDDQMTRFPDEDYLVFFRAKAYAAIGELERAGILFQKLADTSFNGMLLLYSQEICDEKGITIKPRNLAAVPADQSAQPLPKLKNIFQNTTLLNELVNDARRNHDFDAKDEAYLAVKEALVPLAAKIEDYQRLRRLSSDRFFVWERTYPVKERILAAADKGDIESLRKVAKSYIDGVYRQYDNDSLGLFIDADVEKACMPVFLEDRGQEFVDRFLSLTPSEHRENMDDMMRRRGIDHPYLR